MRTILSTITVLGLSLVAACGSKADDALGKMEAYKTELCACPDTICAEKVMTEMGKYFEEWTKDNAKAKPSKEQDERADKLQAEMSACMDKLKKK